jgi:hypothetical protein
MVFRRQPRCLVFSTFFSSHTLCLCYRIFLFSATLHVAHLQGFSSLLYLVFSTTPRYTHKKLSLRCILLHVLRETYRVCNAILYPVYHNMAKNVIYTPQLLCSSTLCTFSLLTLTIVSFHLRCSCSTAASASAPVKNSTAPVPDSRERPAS